MHYDQQREKELDDERDRLNKLEDKIMKVNDEVKINPDNVPNYFDYESNPVHLTGKVLFIHDIEEHDDLNIDVEFSNGVLNVYSEEHLIILETSNEH